MKSALAGKIINYVFAFPPGRICYDVRNTSMDGKEEALDTHLYNLITRLSVIFVFSFQGGRCPYA